MRKEVLKWSKAKSFEGYCLNKYHGELCVCGITKEDQGD